MDNPMENLIKILVQAGINYDAARAIALLANNAGDTTTAISNIIGEIGMKAVIDLMENNIDPVWSKIGCGDDGE